MTLRQPKTVCSSSVVNIDGGARLKKKDQWQGKPADVAEKTVVFRRLGIMVRTFFKSMLRSKSTDAPNGCPRGPDTGGHWT